MYKTRVLEYTCSCLLRAYNDNIVLFKPFFLLPSVSVTRVPYDLWLSAGRVHAVSTES